MKRKTLKELTLKDNFMFGAVMSIEESFMIWKEMLREERTAGKASAILEFLEEIGEVSEELKERIMNETKLPVLTSWVKLAAKSESVEYFMQNM